MEIKLDFSLFHHGPIKHWQNVRLKLQLLILIYSAFPKAMMVEMVVETGVWQDASCQDKI